MDRLGSVNCHCFPSCSKCCLTTWYMNILTIWSTAEQESRSLHVLVDCYWSSWGYIFKCTLMQSCSTYLLSLVSQRWWLKRSLSFLLVVPVQLVGWLEILQMSPLYYEINPTNVEKKHTLHIHYIHYVAYRLMTKKMWWRMHTHSVWFPE